MAVVGVGFDLVDIDRADRILRRHGERAYHRFLLPAERSYVKAMAHPARHFAGRLAAKEAVYKALAPFRGSSTIGWRDIEVVRDRRGRPGILLHGRAREVAVTLGGVAVSISLTHTERTAGALALVQRKTSVG